MKFKLGDMVIVKKYGRFRNQRKYGIGEIVLITRDRPYSYTVRYEDGVEMLYDDCDLEDAIREISDWEEELNEDNNRTTI